jgi:hypothetical protein
MDEKNIVPIIVTDKINPILRLVFLLLINIARSYLNIIAFIYAACIKKGEDSTHDTRIRVI